MPGSVKVRMTKPYNRTIPVLIAGTILVYPRLIGSVYIMRNRIGIRTELYQTMRYASPRESMPHAVRADQRIHIIDFLLTVYR